jgi:hypothetical protein
MAVFSPADWPEAFVSDTTISRAVNRATAAGTLRRIGSRLYTRNLTDTPDAIVRRNLWQIVSGYFPGALIADRTALENAPAEDGSVCLVADGGSNVVLPGIVLRPRRGVAPLVADRPFVAGLHLSSTARAYLENMCASRRSRDGHVARTLTRPEIEGRLETLLRRSGIEALNQLRDQIRDLAPVLGLEAEGAALEALIGALLGTRDTVLSTSAARARRAGRPYDPERVQLFHTLHRSLREHLHAPRPAPLRDAAATATLAFFEAYFSNFIEGTEFEVDEAAAIVFGGHIPAGRPEDAHDVLGTWRIVSDPDEMCRTPATAMELLTLLRRRHAAIMEQRPAKSPGQFKSMANRAGQTVFVAPDLVEGTLAEGLSLCHSMETPFQRAVFMMFLVAEVHPFADGNGRTARIMMNAELIAAQEERIVIPTVYRGNYLAALKALSLTGTADPLIRTLDYAQRWTRAMPWGDVQTTRRALEACHAFLDTASADAAGVRLSMPQEGHNL